VALLWILLDETAVVTGVYFHLAGILLTSFLPVFGRYSFQPLTIGMHGTVEAACNPLVTALYPETKTTKLNHFHLWFPVVL